MERYVIHVTKKCNMECVYCYETDKTSTYTWEEIKNLIDTIVKYNKNFEVEFLGGEPLLAFDLVKKSVEYLDRMEDVFIPNYIITTNGTILNDEIVQFLKDHENITYAVSLDGGYYANQLRMMKAGGNSYDLAMPNIKRVIEEVGVRRTHVHIVAHPYNVGLLNKSVDRLYNEGVRSINIGIVENKMILGEEFFNRFVFEMNKISERIINDVYYDLVVNELEELKPKDDVRHYIYEGDKVVAESYGRAKNDIVSHDDYNFKAGYSESSEYHQKLRETVYENHQQNRLKNNTK